MQAKSAYITNCWLSSIESLTIVYPDRSDSESSAIIFFSKDFLLGNQMSMYEHDVASTSVDYYLAERNIYGSSRLGTTRDTINMFLPNTLPSYGVVGNRNYELSNHLGNVLAVVNDVIYPLEDGSGNITSYETGLLQVSDYSPFGVQLDGRTISNGDYRYSFNGAERDDEVKGAGNSLDFGARMYDPRVGRWLSIDPLESRFHYESPYNFSGNSPILYKDEKGKYKVPKNLQKKYPLFTLIVSNIGGLVRSDEILQKNLKSHGHYEDLSAMLEVFGNDSGPLVSVNNDGLAEGSTDFLRETEKGFPSENLPLENTTTNDLIVNVAKANVKSMEKKFKKLLNPDLSEQKRDKIMSKLEKDVHHIVTTLLHEGVHVGDALENGFFSNKDVDGNSYEDYNSTNPMNELGAAAMERSGYTKNAFPSQADNELIERVVKEVLQGVENLIENSKEDD